MLKAQGRLKEAAAAFRKAIRLDSRYPKALYNLGTVLYDSEQWKAAGTKLRKALGLQPDYAQAMMLLGMVLAEQGKFDEASGLFHRAQQLRPHDAKIYLNYGNALLKEKHLEEALKNYRQALALRPGYPEALFAQGNVFNQQKQHERAVDSYQAALQARPDWAEAHHHLGSALNELARFQESSAAFHRALELKPNFPEAVASLLRVLSRTCDWRELDKHVAQLKQATAGHLASGKTSPISSSQANAYDFSMAEKLAIAKSHAGSIEDRLAATRARLNFTHPTRNSSPERLRIGYLSYDFRNHATSHLMRTLFGLHDRARFEIFTYSYGPDDASEYRQKIAEDSDHFIDLADVDEVESARRINANGVHILVDLMGFVANCRPDIPALCPAPIQVNYLGYPGTMGVDFMDYIITDRIISPPEHAQYYTEALVHMPHTYQVTDYQQPIADDPVTRADEGLPESGFIFCCFNTLYKVEPVMFDVWMRVMKQAPGSVLWMLTKYDEVKENLRQEMAARGVDPQRLVFAEGKYKPHHLARFQLADLFLDTRFYNAHTTTSDALWAGVPVLTCLGETFPARVAASILKAVGLPELIVPDLATYEREAVRLATSPDVLAALKAKLTANRTTYPLFDTLRFTRNLEWAYEAMWSQYAAGQKPEMIVVEGGGQRWAEQHRRRLWGQHAPLPHRCAGRRSGHRRRRRTTATTGEPTRDSAPSGPGRPHSPGQGYTQPSPCPRAVCRTAGSCGCAYPQRERDGATDGDARWKPGRGESGRRRATRTGRRQRDSHPGRTGCAAGARGRAASFPRLRRDTGGHYGSGRCLCGRLCRGPGRKQTIGRGSTVGERGGRTGHNQTGRSILSTQSACYLTD